MMTSLYSEPIPVTEITSDWRKFHFPRDSRVITCVNLNLGGDPLIKFLRNALTFERVLQRPAPSHLWTSNRPRMRYPTSQQLP